MSSSSSNKDSKIIITRLVKKFKMKAHPEGGFYAETYRSPHKVKSSYGERSASTAIYFLITPGSVSRLHRIKADEVWHFYLGGPMTVLELNESDGSMKKTGTLSLSLSLFETTTTTKSKTHSTRFERSFLVRDGSIHCKGKHMVRFLSESRNEFQFCWMYGVTWIRV